ncbi:NTP transferase domain-containing protein [Kribbella sp. NPDC004875]|uniref:nucleotidyltransferase family protein n=1 Tax=Kribbella sp. NPDC004875 TaxID=3364107 RepID=UPI003674CB8D
MKNAARSEAGIAGLVLAAGAGRRMGRPKALIRAADGVAWVVRTARVLGEAGCSPVVVVVGAAADDVRAELSGEPVTVVEATDWAEGMSASLRAGLTYLRTASADAVSVVTVDVPGLTPEVVRRVDARAGSAVLARAMYDGRVGHPVLIGREHWDGVVAVAHGDEGARPYLRGRDVVAVECADLADGLDVDTVEELPPGHG